MASPFAVFRKNQKLMMVALTVLAMVAFVLTDAFTITGSGGGGGGGSPQNPLVVETNRFALHEADMQQAIMNRELVHRFVVRAVFQILEQAQIQQMRAQFPQISQDQLARFIPYDRIAQQADTYTTERFGTTDERSVIEALVLADEARRLGVQVSDSQVISFISQTVQGMLNAEQLNNILRSLGGNNSKVSERQLTEAFRGEMLASQMRMIFAGVPAMVTTPVDRWNFYLRKRCRATAEVLPVRTADLIAETKIADPSPAELQAFFEQSQYDEPQPGSSKPGFKIPQKSQFQFFAADEAKFREPEKITAEQIAAHYDANKSRYPYTPEEFSDAAPAGEKKPEPAKTEPAKTEPAVKTEPAKTEPAKTAPEKKPEAEKKPEPAKPDPVKTEPAKTQPETKPAEEKKPAPEKKPASDDKPAAAKDGAAKSATKIAPDCGIEDLDLDGPSSCDAPDEAKKEDAKKDDAKPAAATPTTTTAAVTPATTTTGTGTVTTTAAAVTTTTGTAATSAAAPALPPPPLPTESQLLPNDVRTGRTPQYDPLWKVEKKIREELARKAAADKVKAIFEALKPKLIDAALARDPKSEQPAFDEKAWAALVAEHPSLVAGTTPLMTQVDVVRAAEKPGFFKSTLSGEPIARAAFAEAAVYVPKESLEIPEFAIDSTEEATTRYLFWKIKNEPAKVPELKDVRDSVIFAWKTQKVREATRKRAEELAAKAKLSPKPLRELFPDAGVQLTNAFTWYEVDLSGGFNQQATPTRISDVDGVEDPGSEFMQTVFDLDVDQTATAMNSPGTICYVIRLTSINPPRTQLYDSFMVDHFETYRQFSQEDAGRDVREAVDSLLADAKIRWLREPRERNRYAR